MLDFLASGQMNRQAIMKSGLDAMPLFLLDDLLKEGFRCTTWKSNFEVNFERTFAL